MPTLNDMLGKAHGGQAMDTLGREFGLTPEQTEAAVTALLPAISTGLKQSTATPEGLANLFRVVGQQPDLRMMDSDVQTAFGQSGRAAGNEVLSALFGSPDVSRAVTDQAQQLSGVGSGILRKLLPVLAGMLISQMMKSAKAAPSPSAPTTSTGSGGSLGDILGQIFGSAKPGSSAAPVNLPQQQPIPGATPGTQAPLPIPQQPLPIPGDRPLNIPANTIPGNTDGQPVPGGGLLEVILRELQKGIQEGRVKPVIVPLPLPSQTPGSGPAPQDTSGDILGQILRDVLGGTSATIPGMPGATQTRSLMQGLLDSSQQVGAGTAVFGQQLEAGRDVSQSYLESIQNIFDRSFASRQA
jgi:hypothetical protein